MSEAITKPGKRGRAVWTRILLVSVGGMFAWWIYATRQEFARQDALLAVTIDGMQHIGPDFNIAEFYLNGTNGFNVGREGGGGSDVCCVLLPKQWRRGLSVDLRWAVGDWTNVNPTDKDETRRIPAFTIFRARVPVDRYENPGRIVVHFFDGGKARVSAGWPEPDELRHVVLPAGSHATDTATTGHRADDLFSKEEIEALRRGEEERTNSFFGGGTGNEQ